MPVLEPHYSKEEFVQRGQAIYERDIRPSLRQRTTANSWRFTSLPARTNWTGTIA
jgi:hypothetical protein